MKEIRKANYMYLTVIYLLHSTDLSSRGEIRKSHHTNEISPANLIKCGPCGNVTFNKPFIHYYAQNF